MLVDACFRLKGGFVGLSRVSVPLRTVTMSGTNAGQSHEKYECRSGVAPMTIAESTGTVCVWAGVTAPQPYSIVSIYLKLSYLFLNVYSILNSFVCLWAGISPGGSFRGGTFLLGEFRPATLAEVSLIPL